MQLRYLLCSALLLGSCSGASHWIDDDDRQLYAVSSLCDALDHRTDEKSVTLAGWMSRSDDGSLRYSEPSCRGSCGREPSLPVTVAEEETAQSFTLTAIVAHGPAKVVARGHLMGSEGDANACALTFAVDRLLKVGVAEAETE